MRLPSAQLHGLYPSWSIFSLKRCAFQTIRPVVSRKKRGFSAHFGPGGVVPPPRVSPFSKLKRPGRIEPVSLCASRLLPGAGGRSPARRGAWGERGKSPLHPLHPRTPLCAGTRNLSLELGRPPSAACRMGHRREPSPACGRGDVRACCGAPSALRASGIAFAPAHAASAVRGGRGTLSGGSKGGKLADGRAAISPLTSGRANCAAA